jgi:hypothetical protein
MIGSLSQTGTIEVRADTLAGAKVVRLAGRYGLAALGPLSTSAAHFLASFIFLRTLPPAEFGLFSFLLVVVPFCLSMSGALLGASASATLNLWPKVDGPELGTHLKANLVYSALAACAVALAVSASGADTLLALQLGVFGGLMALRWFARCLAYVLERPLRSALSDLAYSAIVVSGLLALLASHRLSLSNGAWVLLVAAAFSLLIFGSDYLSRQFWPKGRGSLAAYAPIWRDLTRWSLLGVVLTEVTINAHAYLVTFFAGPKSFALLAIGSLLMRPVSLALTALPDRERASMARAIAAGNGAGAFQTVKEFRTAIGAIWLAAVLLAGAILTWFPGLLLKKGYDLHDVLIVLTISAAIMAVRSFRTPESVLLQAAGEFKPLAHASMVSSIVSVTSTLTLLLIAGPIASLGGILLGDALMTVRTQSLARAWRHRHV